MPQMNFSNSPAEILAALLVALGNGIQWSGLATDPDLTAPSDNPPTWPVYYDLEPGEPDNCITVRNTVGRSGGRSMPDGEQRYHYGFQVRVRAGGDVSQASVSDVRKLGWQKISAIRSACAETVYQNIVSTHDGHTYDVACVVGIGPVMHLGYENPRSKRELWTWNALLVFRQMS